MIYNPENVFAKIIAGTMPCKKIFEDEHVLSFWDIHPKAKFHALVITKKKFVNFEDFIKKSELHEVGMFFQKVNFIATEILKLNNNFKMLTHNGKDANQEIEHFHIHILSNKS